jgi:hypothetical protein
MSKGGVWWFLVFAGAIAAAAVVRYAVNGGFSAGTGSEKFLYIVVALFAVIALSLGLFQVIKKGRHIEVKDGQDEDLRIT